MNQVINGKEDVSGKNGHRTVQVQKLDDSKVMVMSHTKAPGTLHHMAMTRTPDGKLKSEITNKDSKSLFSNSTEENHHANINTYGADVSLLV